MPAANEFPHASLPDYTPNLWANIYRCAYEYTSLYYMVVVFEHWNKFSRCGQSFDQ